MLLHNFITRLKRLPWLVILASLALGLLGILLLYGAAGGSMDPYAWRQLVRLTAAMVLMILMAMMPLKLFYEYAYFFYGGSLLLVLAVNFMGTTGMGAQRWINLGVIVLQPSELMKVGLVLALARFYQCCTSISMHSLKNLGLAFLFILLPAFLVLQQPDLGTALILVILGAGMLFAAGINWRLFAGGGVMGLIMLPIAWFFVLHDYQKQRVLTFLNPESDPAGAGYHIIQSKIAIGSAGFWGKGFLQGSQGQLLFLPEKHTDFIFSLLTEDFGMAGALGLLGLYTILLSACLRVAYRVHNVFSMLVVIGITMMIFLHAFINIAMVMGLLPVVGVPLPFISYGGSSLLTLFIGLGFIVNAHTNRDVLLRAGPGLAGRSF